MSVLSQYMLEHADRNACRCGQCVVSDKVLPGHTVDMFFFDVCAKNKPDREVLKRLCLEHEGEFCSLDLFDGVEHNYIDIGGWIGDQGLALMLMGLGELLGLWQVLQPKMFHLGDEKLEKQMAENGYVTILAKRS